MKKAFFSAILKTDKLIQKEKKNMCFFKKRKAKKEAERLAKEKAEQERLEKERLAKEKAEEERKAKEKAEAEAKAKKEKAAKAKATKEAKAKVEKEKAEKEEKTSKTAKKSVKEEKKTEEKPVTAAEEPKERKAVYRVVFDKEDNLWKIKKDGAKRVIGSMKTKEAALARVQELSANQDHKFVVYKKDGKFQKKANLKLKSNKTEE